jgi:hypothetical protein
MFGMAAQVVAVSSEEASSITIISTSLAAARPLAIARRNLSGRSCVVMMMLARGDVMLT